jgi:hypothetical protein
MQVNGELHCHTYIALLTLRSTQQSLRSLVGTNAHMDVLIPLLALGIHHGVWEQDIVPWFSGTDLPTLPFTLIIKKELQYTSVMKAVHQPKRNAPASENEHQPCSSAEPKPQMYRALSASSLGTLLCEVAAFIGWDSE